MKYEYNPDELVHLYNGISRLIKEELDERYSDKKKIKELRHLQSKIHLEI